MYCLECEHFVIMCCGALSFAFVFHPDIIRRARQNHSRNHLTDQGHRRHCC
jgi:hypothetical protein